MKGKSTNKQTKEKLYSYETTLNTTLHNIIKKI